MDIILFTKRRERPVTLRLSPFGLSGLASAVLILVIASLLGAGYWIGGQVARANAVSPEVVAAWKKEMAGQRNAVIAARQQAQSYVDALALRTGQLQAQVMRLNALGQRLTKMANLDNGEFDFDQPPAQGGPEEASDGSNQDVADLLEAMDRLASQLNDREHQLGALETMMVHSNLQRQVYPAGRPITKGWLSSYFGKRADPFTGKTEFHEGMDFAGREGSAVVAVAAGVVIWSGERSGYGNLIEIDHGNGYTTRYGHNEKNLVKVGDRVTKGQKIALMGSTGRSTGPHVHFEVLQDGHQVNPEKYIRAQR